MTLYITVKMGKLERNLFVNDNEDKTRNAHIEND